MNENLIIPALALALTAVFFWLSWRQGWLFLLQQQRRNRMLRGGREAEAVVLQVETTGMLLRQRTQVMMQLKVQPEYGKNFVVVTRELLSVQELARLRAGARLRVRYHPRNRQCVALLQ